MILRFFCTRGGVLRSPSVAGLMCRYCEEDEAEPAVGARSSPVEQGAVDIYFPDLGQLCHWHKNPDGEARRVENK